MTSVYIMNKEIIIRQMRDEVNDYNLMYKWLNNLQVLMYYEGRDKPFSMENIIKKYGPRAKGKSDVISCIIEYRSLPIGYIQYYPIDKIELYEYGYEENELIYGMDIFIGDTNYQNKGLGQKVISILINYIYNTYKPNKIIIDPRIENIRAVKCYEKCGFKIKKILYKHELHEGVYHDNYLMEINIDN